MKHIVNFSGGKDSTAMLLMMLEKGVSIDRVICIDTTKEFPQMYEHIERVQELVTPLKIEIYKIDFDYYFSEHVKTKGKNKGSKGYGWASNRTRWCTSLKRSMSNRIVYGDGEYIPRSQKVGRVSYSGFTEYLGIAADESKRLEKNHTGRNLVYPLTEWGITESQALQYCYYRGLDWGGLYEKFGRVSCWCCPLKRLEEYEALRTYEPALWKEVRAMDSKTERNFKTSYSLDQLEEKLDKRLEKMK